MFPDRFLIRKESHVSNDITKLIFFPTVTINSYRESKFQAEF